MSAFALCSSGFDVLHKFQLEASKKVFPFARLVLLVDFSFVRRTQINFVPCRGARYGAKRLHLLFYCYRMCISIWMWWKHVFIEFSLILMSLFVGNNHEYAEFSVEKKCFFRRSKYRTSAHINSECAREYMCCSC